MAFEGLSEKLNVAFKRLRGKGRLTENDVREAMREVRLALLEADVSYKVVKEFVATVTERAVGTDVLDSLTPAQQVVKIVNEELTNLMGGGTAKLSLANNDPTVVMMVGLQGAGKTTNGAKLAGMMAAAILSDTVMFKSPTCTPRDIRTAERMARIADVSLDELGHEIFSAAVENKSVEEVFFTDYKEFHIAGHSLAVSQLTCVDSPSVLKRKDEFLKLMKKTAEEKMFDLVIMMLTDVLLEGTQLLYVGSDEAIRNAFSAEPKDNALFLPGVMSRKKQVIPMLSALWG